MGAKQSSGIDVNDERTFVKGNSYVESLLQVQHKNYLESNCMESKDVLIKRRDRVLNVLRERKVAKPYALQLLEVRASSKKNRPQVDDLLDPKDYPLKVQHTTAVAKRAIVQIKSTKMRQSTVSSSGPVDVSATSASRPQTPKAFSPSTPVLACPSLSTPPSESSDQSSTPPGSEEESVTTEHADTPAKSKAEASSQTFLPHELPSTLVHLPSPTTGSTPDQPTVSSQSQGIGTFHPIPPPPPPDRPPSPTPANRQATQETSTSTESTAPPQQQQIEAGLAHDRTPSPSFRQPTPTARQRPTSPNRHQSTQVYSYPAEPTRPHRQTYPTTSRSHSHQTPVASPPDDSVPTVRQSTTCQSRSTLATNRLVPVTPPPRRPPSPPPLRQPTVRILSARESLGTIYSKSDPECHIKQPSFRSMGDTQEQEHGKVTRSNVKSVAWQDKVYSWHRGLIPQAHPMATDLYDEEFVNCRYGGSTRTEKPTEDDSFERRRLADLDRQTDSMIASWGSSKSSAEMLGLDHTGYSLLSYGASGYRFGEVPHRPVTRGTKRDLSRHRTVTGHRHHRGKLVSTGSYSSHLFFKSSNTLVSCDSYCDGRCCRHRQK